MLNIQFEHEKKTVPSSLLLTDEKADYISVLIFYQTVSDFLYVKEKFGVDLTTDKNAVVKEKVPSEYIGITGTLSRILPYCQNDQEIAYLLLSYREKREAAVKLVGVFHASNVVDAIEKEREQGFTEEEKERAEFIKKMFAPDPRVKAFLSYIEDSNGSFQVFQSLIPADDAFKYLKDVMDTMMAKIKMIELLGR